MVGQVGQIVTRFKLAPDNIGIQRAPYPTELLYAYTVFFIFTIKMLNNDNLTHKRCKAACLLAFPVGHDTHAINPQRDNLTHATKTLASATNSVTLESQ